MTDGFFIDGGAMAVHTGAVAEMVTKAEMKLLERSHTKYDKRINDLIFRRHELLKRIREQEKEARSIQKQINDLMAKAVAELRKQGK